VAELHQIEANDSRRAGFVKTPLTWREISPDFQNLLCKLSAYNQEASKMAHKNKSRLRADE
jgi:hypothetical protein